MRRGFGQLAVALKSAKIRGAVPEVYSDEQGAGRTDLPVGDAHPKDVDGVDVDREGRAEVDQATDEDRQEATPVARTIHEALIIGECVEDREWLDLGVPVSSLLLCPVTRWDMELARLKADVVKVVIHRDDITRVLTWGRAARVFGVYTRRFGVASKMISGRMVQFGCIPHPRKLNGPDLDRAKDYADWLAYGGNAP